MLRPFAIAVLGWSLISAGSVQPVKAQESSKQVAEEKAQATLQKAAEAQKAAAAAAAQAAAARAQAAAAAAQAAAVRAGAARGTPERDVVDPLDPIERFALLTPGGPLVVKASLTIDGRPFRQAREELIREMIAAADQDQDGKTTWTEAMASRRFTLGRITAPNDQIKQSIIRNYDANSNGQVEQDEARKILAQYGQGGTFSLGSGAGFVRVITAAGASFGAANNQVDLLPLLDTNRDKSLDVKELAAAAARLKSRDADDNDVLDSAEITGQPQAANRLVVDSRTLQPGMVAVLLGPAATKEVVFILIQQRYKNTDGKLSAGCFPQFPALFAALDKNGDGEVAAGEILGLNEVTPHVELTVDLAVETVAGGLAIQSLSPELVQPAAPARQLRVIELPGVRISLAASAGPAMRQSYEALGASLLTRYDGNGNGYLEATEVPAMQFEMFDQNGDGKAYPAEVVASYIRNNAPQWTQVVANVVNQGNSLFQTLDANGDGRVGLREMRGAAERIAALDKDANGSVGGNEIPETINVAFALGGSAPGGVALRSPGMPAAPAGRTVNGAPEWFNRMDRNNDGDLTLKEFLGDEADFKRLDANSDGLLDPKEAEVAGR